VHTRTRLLLLALATAVVGLGVWWLLFPSPKTRRPEARAHPIVVRRSAQPPKTIVSGGGGAASAGEGAASAAALADAQPTQFTDAAPLAWPDDTPEAYGPDVFPDQAATILSDCAPGIVPLWADCTEPPCFLVARDERTLHFPGLFPPWAPCTAWNRLYGSDDVSLLSTGIDCSGSTETVMVFAPESSWLTARGVSDEDLVMRFFQRTQTLAQEWHCQEEPGQ
jgi:hypothetical protein